MNRFLKQQSSPPSVKLRTASFTLIELLIVIGILAILTAAVVIVLNPTELLKQGRDSTRMTDLASIHKTIQLLLTQNPQVSLGTASTVYVSVPDTSATCSNLSLPSLPSGFTYHCVPQASSTLVNGQGWLPIDFTSTIQNLTQVPLDPTNTSSTGLYYAYTTNGTNYELTNALESTKYKDKTTADGGSNQALCEKGTSLSFASFIGGPYVPWYNDFHNWTLSSGVSVDSDGALVFTAYGQTATSPYIPINERVWTAYADFYMTQQSPYATFQPNGGLLWNSLYFDNSFISKTNSGGYSGNGNAQSVPLNVWTTKSVVTSATYSGIYFLKITIESNSTWTPPAFKVKNFRITI